MVSAHHAAPAGAQARRRPAGWPGQRGSRWSGRQPALAAVPPASEAWRASAGGALAALPSRPRPHALSGHRTRWVCGRPPAASPAARPPGPVPAARPRGVAISGDTGNQRVSGSAADPSPVPREGGGPGTTPRRHAWSGHCTAGPRPGIGAATARRSGAHAAAGDRALRRRLPADWAAQARPATRDAPAPPGTPAPPGPPAAG
jgi:hypothetical protein